jgi:NitT/TauT family transport system permease protein
MLKYWIARIAFYTSLLIIWYVIYSLNVLPDYILPSPLQVGNEYISAADRLLVSIATSMQRLVAGFILSLLLGFGLGYAMAKYRLLHTSISSFVTALASLPSIVWVPIAMIWFGYSDMMILFVIMVGTLFAFALSTYTSIKNISPLYIKAARNMGANGIKMLAHVTIPAATPNLIIGIRNAWSLAWRGLMNAEVLSGYLGLGFMLESAREVFNMSQVIAVVLVIMVIGMLFDALFFSRIERYVEYRWGLR